MRAAPAVALTVLAFLFCARGAVADTHVFSTSFNGSGQTFVANPSPVAVDNSSGLSAHDVYVGDYRERRVAKFDSAGRLILVFGKDVDQTTGGDVCTVASGDVCKTAVLAGQPGSFYRPEDIAVDSSSGPSAGDVYVGEERRVAKFDPSGHPIASWGDGGQLPFSIARGIAVDPAGDLLVMEANGSKLFRYDSNGNEKSAIALNDEAGGRTLSTDAAGNVYLVRGGAVQKLSPAGADLGTLAGMTDAVAVTVDRSRGDLYVRRAGGEITRFSSCAWPGCSAVETFGDGYLAEWGSVAVDESSGVAYAEKGSYVRGEVVAFARQGDVPEVKTGDSSSIVKSTAVVEGRVDPAALAPIVDCHFQLVTEPGFLESGYATARTFPCDQATPFSGPRDVSAHLTGLLGGVDYRYRIVAGRGGPVRTGEDRTFRTLNLADAVTGAATDVGADWATVTGSVDPDRAGKIVDCHFEVVAEAQFLASGFAAAASVPCILSVPIFVPSDVASRLSSLIPATAYRYRLVAGTEDGAVAGSAARLVTEAAPRKRRAKPRVRRVARRVHCSAKACTHRFDGSVRPRKWASPKFPVSFGWLFSVYKDGRSLSHTRPAGGCISTFSGRGMIATLNGCHGRFRLTYIGRGDFLVRWRVFESCRCAASAGRPAPAALGLSLPALRPVARTFR
jgi:hypothetical protein